MVIFSQAARHVWMKQKKILTIFSLVHLKKIDSNVFLNFKPLVPTTPVFACKCWWAIPLIIISFSIYLILCVFLHILYVAFEIKAKLSVTSKDRNKWARISLCCDWFQVIWHLSKNGPHCSRRWHSPLPPLLPWPRNGSHYHLVNIYCQQKHCAVLDIHYWCFSQQPCKVGIICILQMRKLRLREVKWFPRSSSGRWQSQDKNPGGSRHLLSIPLCLLGCSDPRSYSGGPWGPGGVHTSPLPASFPGLWSWPGMNTTRRKNSDQ